MLFLKTGRMAEAHVHASILGAVARLRGVGVDAGVNPALGKRAYEPRGSIPEIVRWQRGKG